ncbi:uncharacterized protein L3040_008861 [Drepanopeziza brunnea f. sp. 'multigermtubi']|uniref:uncharacterized protein n=1 Tax=Drepanopeziza brunnea f. sp. 'multigermtubi' TaxID=698441 RepID=UPI002387A687|nr:hypothetical protein L3040_008861 [Drepanopeziza brunnea f. sp. 'multigermtubi']
MQFVTVLSVAALINTAVALQPLAPELMKKYPVNPFKLMPQIVATSAIADPENLAISVASSVRSTVSSIYTFPNSTSSASSTAYPTASSSSSSLFLTQPQTLPGTLTITEGITYTLFLPTPSSTNHTWTNTASSVPYLPSPPFPPTNATALTNRTTFTLIPFPSYGSSLSTTLTSLATTTSSSSLAVDTGTSSSTLEALSIPLSADPIFSGSPSAVLHPVTTVSQTTTVTGGQATGAPDPAALHCGIHRLPNGAYKMAEYWEETRGVWVTLLGCFEGANDGGCFSYSFYRDQGTGAPRCDLSGMAWTASSRRCRACGTISTVASLR